MYATAFKLTRESIIDHAKLVIQPLACDWDKCTIVLNSWTALREHQHSHCSRSKISLEGHGSTFQCKIIKCAGREHSSLEALLAHIDMSHMVRVSLPCPVKACVFEGTLAKSMHLVSHFEDAHQDLVNQSGAGLSSFKPVSQPLPHHRRLLEPLPVSPSSLLRPVSLPLGKKHWSTSTGPPLSQQSSSPLKRRRTHLSVVDEKEDDDADTSSPRLGHLPPAPTQDTPNTITSAMILPTVQLHGSRVLESATLSAPPYSIFKKAGQEPESPLSMSYHAFSLRYEQLEKAGLVRGDGIWPEARQHLPPPPPPARARETALLGAPPKHPRVRLLASVNSP
ncbi:hypothetical protein FA95DRAFT_1561537 [Auriscalpium vulgare]|uniref:Uncharacterized protein n=1 Tax=Auriscalpium vulgare TaxID=40419 RepID=A0ACB8RLJ7_9AGAM|nr:hypothetical protein FA95DRAFT_1561537 [Auriscalpium vulgare]